MTSTGLLKETWHSGYSSTYKKKRHQFGITETEAEQAKELNGQLTVVSNKIERIQVPLFERSALFYEEYRRIKRRSKQTSERSEPLQSYRI